MEAVMKCLYCKRKIPKEAKKKIKELKVDPYCIVCLSLIYSGIPLSFQMSKIMTERGKNESKKSSL